MEPTDRQRLAALIKIWENYAALHKEMTGQLRRQAEGFTGICKELMRKILPHNKMF